MTAFNLKIGEKHKFALRLIARIKGDSMGATMEKVIEDTAAALEIGRSWTDLWDEEPSVATLNLFALPEYKPTKQVQKAIGLKDESTVRAFVMAHTDFFYTDDSLAYPRRKFAVVLWPHVEQLSKEWKQTRDDDYYGAAKQMLALLKKALPTDPDCKALVKHMATLTK